jgi:hypothetical protein
VEARGQAGRGGPEVKDHVEVSILRGLVELVRILEMTGAMDLMRAARAAQEGLMPVQGARPAGRSL